MRIFLLSFSLVWFVLGANAQLTVEVLLDEPEFLRDESLVVRVRVTNQSGRPLHLGQSNDWLSFNVQGSDGSAVVKQADPSVLGEFTVASAQSATKSVDIMPCFDFPDAGRYVVSATVRIPQWDGEVSSGPKSFHIIKGSRLWEEEFGVPAKEGVPDVRKYSLIRANGLKQQRLYVRVTDAIERHVFRVVPLGPVVSFGRPEAQVDGSSSLHLLFQNGPRSFLYGAFSPNGNWQSRLTFDYGATRPTLQINDKGRVYVAGGLRRATPTDFPPPAKAASAADLPSPPLAPAPVPAPAAPTASQLKDDKPTKP